MLNARASSNAAKALSGINTHTKSVIWRAGKKMTSNNATNIQMVKKIIFLMLLRMPRTMANRASMNASG